MTKENIGEASSSTWTWMCMFKKCYPIKSGQEFCKPVEIPFEVSVCVYDMMLMYQSKDV